MLRFKNYVKAASLEEAWTLKQKKGNVVLGGMLWLKMQRRNVNTAIDLSGLGLDTIEETPEEFVIGCMTTLRQLETHPGLLQYTHGACREAVRHIVGIQFRNLATVGGSLWGRFGFSDVLTLFLGLDAEVELYKAGRVPIREFAAMAYDKDLLVAVHVKKTPLRIAMTSLRNSKTDFPVLVCTLSCLNGEIRAVVGARPARAVVFCEQGAADDAETQKMMIERVQKEVVLGSNMRASEEYRRHLTGVLLERCRKALEEQEVEA